MTDKQKVKAGMVLVKIPRAAGKAGDITGGLPRVTELFEARNPSNPAVVSEIDGEVSLGKIKRGNREIIVTTKTGDVKKYMVPFQNKFLFRKTIILEQELHFPMVQLLLLIFWLLKGQLLFRNIF